MKKLFSFRGYNTTVGVKKFKQIFVKVMFFCNFYYHYQYTLLFHYLYFLYWYLNSSTNTTENKNLKNKIKISQIYHLITLHANKTSILVLHKTINKNVWKTCVYPLPDDLITCKTRDMLNIFLYTQYTLKHIV